MMRRPPAIAPGERDLPMNAQSARATMKMVRLRGVSAVGERRVQGQDVERDEEGEGRRLTAPLLKREQVR